MEDFLLYFMAGMLGEEFVRRLATRPRGFLWLWGMAAITTNLLVFIFILGLGVIGLIRSGRDGGSGHPFSLSVFFHDLMVFFFFMIQPWELGLSLITGLAFAISYRQHYRRNTEASVKNEGIDR